MYILYVMAKIINDLEKMWYIKILFFDAVVNIDNNLNR